MVRFQMTIRRTALLLCSALLAATLFGFLGSWWTGRELAAGHERMSTLAIAMRNHTEGDMYHDALRGSVYQALYEAHIGNDSARHNILAEQKDVIAHWTALIDKTARLPVAPAIKSMLAAEDAPLKAYIAEGSRMTALAFEDDFTAASKLPQFEAAFGTLEETLGAISTTMEAEVARESKRYAALYHRDIAARSIAFGLTLISALILALTLLSRVIRPLDRQTRTLAALSDGQLDSTAPDLDRQDEIGALARGLEAFRLAQQRTMEAEATAALERASAEEERRQASAARRHSLAQVANELEQTVLVAIESMAVASGQMRATAHGLKDRAEEMQKSSGDVAQATQNASAELESVSTATQDLARTVDDVSARIDETARTSATASSSSEMTTTHVQALGAASEKVSNVVSFITELANQTNLLALNATIEAARAGEAGRGFGVVANEVKSLSQQTEKAAHEIESEIEAMKAATGDVHGAIDSVCEAMKNLSSHASAIAAAADQQRATTRDISLKIDTVAAATRQLDASMAQIVGEAEATRSDADLLESAVSELDREAAQVRESIVAFIARVRAA
jgi:methyl-accepting chemotaxis protein